MIRAALSLCLGLYATLTAGGGIVVVQKVQSDNESKEMTVKIQGDRIRFDITPAISVIRDVQSGELVTLMHERKGYLRVSSEAAAALRQRVASQVPPSATPSAAPRGKLQPTGRKEKISGFDTEEYIYISGGRRMDLWIARDFPQWSVVMEQMSKLQNTGLDPLVQNLSPDPKELPGMPIRTETEMSGRKVILTVISGKELTLDEKEFQPPTDYKALPQPGFGDDSDEP